MVPSRPGLRLGGKQPHDQFNVYPKLTGVGLDAKLRSSNHKKMRASNHKKMRASNPPLMLGGDGARCWEVGRLSKVNRHDNMSISKFCLPEKGRFGSLDLALGPQPNLTGQSPSG